MIAPIGKATWHVSRYLTRRGKGVGLRVGMKTTGCLGPAYRLEYTDKTATENQVFESNGARVTVGPKSLPYIDGTELDYAREGLNERPRFNNPSMKDEYGCGESLRV